MPRPTLPVKRSLNLGWLIAGPLAVLAAVATLSVVRVHGPDLGDPPVVLGFFALFVFASFTLLRFDIRRQTFSVSLAEIPLLLALFFLPPLGVLATRLLAALLVQLYRRQARNRIAFNLAAFAAGTAAATLIYHLVRPAASASLMLVLAVAVFANVLVTLVAVGGLVTLVQGWGSGRQFFRASPTGLAFAAGNIMIALVMLLALRYSLWAAVPLAGVAVLLALIYRAYAQFLRQHETLTALSEITGLLGPAAQDGTLADVLLTRLREVLRAESATLWLPATGRHAEVLLSAQADYSGLLDRPGTPDELRGAVLSTGRTFAASPRLGDQGDRRRLAEGGLKNVIAVPLRSGTAVIGTLDVAGRLADTAHFTAEDVRLLEMLAAHASITVENSRLVERLRFDAYHDGLTGLPNRRRLVAALNEAVRVHAPGEVVAVMLFDLAGLRAVNDSLGHGAGDRVLAEIAKRIRALAPTSALVARIGGDEFAVTLRISGSEAALSLAEQVKAALQQPVVLDGLTVDVDTRVGIAVHPEHGDDAASLLQHADVAAHAAKLVDRAVQLFNPSLESRSVRRLGLTADLRRALDTGELEVYFQPKVSLADRRLIGVECLARWEHPVHGPVSPADFVAVAEHTGQLRRLTEFVLKEGLRRAREWDEAGCPLAVAVNLSPRTLLDPTFPNRVGELLEQYGVPPGQLTLEITEDGVVGHAERPIPNLRRLRKMGVRLSVDDFGTGYSSLSYLRRLPVHEVKVDRAFVQGMATDPGDLAIVRAVVDISRHFNLTVVAEGVESELTLGLLEEIGCDVGQGFLFSRPLPHERLATWLQAQTASDPAPAGEVRWLRAVP